MRGVPARKEREMAQPTSANRQRGDSRSMACHQAEIVGTIFEQLGTIVPALWLVRAHNFHGRRSFDWIALGLCPQVRARARFRSHLRDLQMIVHLVHLLCFEF
jgi:hypothetical protein